ncbi:MAG: hypothetical protein M5R42_18260 [Rhodocyclaceae bacterium]|nr:hypothetical protein [Rhodocyclaceae bacterium]
MRPYLNEQGLNLTSLLIFAAVMGFGGSLHFTRHLKMDRKKGNGCAGH